MFELFNVTEDEQGLPLRPSPNAVLICAFFIFLSIIALISVHLAVINLLPLPVLDGGYLLILIIEAITRRKLGGKAMEITIVIGWILIMLLFAFTMWNDIARVFGWN